jgi:hypothetical protein
MNITIKPEEIGLQVDIDSPTDVDIKNTIKVEIVNSNAQTIEFDLNMRKALNGDLMIFEHKEIDIIIMTEKNKIVTFAKELMSEIVYGAESRLMEHLRRFGIIEFDSIQGGNVYGSLEGKIHESTERDPVKSTIYQIYKWLQTEKPYMEAIQGHDEMMNDAFLDPDAEHSTELGEVPHQDEKGSINQKGLFSPYFYGRFTY